MNLSIIVPVYNMEEGGRLTYCLDSLLGQTLDPASYEIIAVDDASTDRSLEILRQAQEEHPDRLKVIASPENHHQGGARNRGLEVAKGEYVGFMDADDWADPEMYAKLLAKAEETGADVVGCQYHITDRQGGTGKTAQIHDPAFTGPMTQRMMNHFIKLPGSMVVKIYRRSVIEEHHLRFPEDMFYEDNMAAPIWMSCFARFELVDEPLYAYYQHPGSTVHKTDRSRLEDRMKAGRGFVDYYAAHHLKDAYHDALCSAFTRLYYVNTLFSHMQDSKKTDFKLLKELRQGMRSYFPDFAEVPDYRDNYDAEQRRLLSLHMKSPRLFAAYYRALQLYRRVRYGKKGRREK